jgi:hypothetical protein
VSDEDISSVRKNERKKNTQNITKTKSAKGKKLIFVLTGGEARLEKRGKSRRFVSLSFSTHSTQSFFFDMFRL